MYHIPKDKRSEQSVRLIYNGLISCLKKKGFDRITVSDLQKEFGVARTTIYRSFDNISDILYWKCDTCFHDSLFSSMPSLRFSEMELAKHYFKYWMEHSDILELLMKINRFDIIYACHMKNADALAAQYGRLPNFPAEHGNYFIAIRTGFTVSILTAWLRGGRRETPEEITAIIQEQLVLLQQGSKCDKKAA